MLQLELDQSLEVLEEPEEQVELPLAAPKNRSWTDLESMES